MKAVRLTANDVEQLLLWQHLKKTAPLDAASNVERLVREAAPLLDRVVETFPTYTLHNSRHALNVAALVGELLGEEGLAKLRPLEAAMLLLGAYYHDIGMVCSTRMNGLRSRRSLSGTRF